MSDSRQWSQVGPQPIQNSEIEAELRLLGVDDPYERAKFKRLIRRLDRIEREYHLANLKRTNAK